MVAARKSLNQASKLVSKLPPNVFSRIGDGVVHGNAFGIATLPGGASVTLRGLGVSVRLVGCRPEIEAAWMELIKPLDSVKDAWRVESALKALYAIAIAAGAIRSVDWVDGCY
jgi:hypothetical protein